MDREHLKGMIGDTEKKKITREITEKIIDQTTGELLIEKNTEEAYVSKEPDFIKLYLDNILMINNLPNGLQKSLNVLLKRMGYDNIVVLNAYIKKQMAEELEYKTVQSLNNNINKLVQQGIMIRKGTGTYEMNSFLFGRGTWDNIKKIRLNLVFENGQVTQKAEFERNDEE
ncbi:hypothetical protein [Sporosarcina sp. BP05]|uniref:hypothetical protein n=1 Tax=Sporosarcina sp. BP05 TaxID=2758726 RepID=UPI0016449F7C|nr:hypothetical protein [Sporosarcina sp. BP05]